MPPQVIHVKNAAKVAAALSNEKCQKILEHLGKHTDATETKLSKELSIPLSTVHYNMKVLLEAKLVLGDEYTYSPKGKEMTHYTLNKNPIIIVQEEQQMDLLKAMVPAALIAAGVGIIYSLVRATPSANFAIQETTLADSGQLLAKTAPAAFQAAPQTITQPSMLPWFLAGIALTLIFSIIGIVVIRWLNKKYL